MRKYTKDGAKIFCESLTLSAYSTLGVIRVQAGTKKPVLVLFDRYIIYRAVLRYGIFGQYWMVFSWYFTNRYQRKTWLVHFGIVNLAGTSFSLKRGALAPFLMHPSPLFEEHRSSRQIVQKRSSRQISARQKNGVSMLVCPWSLLVER